ncbi:MAG: ChaN family lipoprotein [Halobacteriovoraceae bacterium]|nr:ChaN family lipoprotein [Halobacteriovoraceae bacterium]MCB9094104.1 ChaN family lipoprotein [Halobacteriovoraceae bacterium]
MRNRVYNTQKQIYTSMKSRALSYDIEVSQDLLHYSQDQEYYAKRNFSKSSMETLIDSIHNSHVIYLGDFHTFDQSSKNLVRIIKNFLQNKSKFAMALELVMQKDQEFLDAFLQNHITELEFLESIDYHESWRFPWNHYKIIFDCLKKYNIEAFGINSGGSLEKRDMTASKVIGDFVQKNPQVPVLVLIGELHILPNKLPKEVKLYLEDLKIRQTIIHQNLDEPYWKIIDAGKDIRSYRVIQFSGNEFCLLSSPPWMKYESMCYWYENLIGDPDFDIHEYIVDKGLKTFSEDTDENFRLILGLLKNYLNIKEEMDFNFNLYDHSNIEFIDDSIEDIKEKRLRGLYEKLLGEHRSFRILDTNKIYCANYSANRLAKLAGQFFYQQYFRELYGVDKLAKIVEKASREEFFNFYTLNFMFSYFFSKIINPFLKCDLYLDIKRLAKTEKDRTRKKRWEQALKILNNFSQYPKVLEKQRMKTIFDLSEIVGELFGEALYEKLNVQDKIFDEKKFKDEYLSCQIDKKAFTKFIKENIIPSNLFKMRRKRYF